MATENEGATVGKVNPTIQIFDSKDYNQSVAAVIAQMISSRLSAGASGCSVGLSGGSTPGGIYTELAQHAEIPWKRVSLFLGDERWVNESDPQSNTRMVRETLMSPTGAAKDARFLPPDTTLDCATGSVRYADLLVKELGAQAVFDLMLLGIGEDGHTASIFPGSELLHHSPDLCAVARHPVNHSTRITVSRGVLERSRVSVFLAKGAGKASVVKRIIKGDEPEEFLPARMFRKFAGKVLFLLDIPAAAEL
jgi:6-phosphogluconolactonase